MIAKCVVCERENCHIHAKKMCRSCYNYSVNKKNSNYLENCKKSYKKWLETHRDLHNKRVAMRNKRIYREKHNLPKSKWKKRKYELE